MKVVIVGAGFGGLRLARKLNNKKNIEVILVNRVNYHQFQPLFYQVATAGLDPSNISFPLRKVFQKSKNVRVRLATLEKVVASENKIVTDTGDIFYDVLVLAMGAGNNFFGNAELAAHAAPMKSTVEAIHLRNRILQNLEDAVLEKDAEARQRRMNMVITGGGPTGVELAGALADMKKSTLPKDYPELDFSKMNIYLLEGGPKVLGAMSEKSSADSKKYLEQLGVKVMVNTLVKTYDGKSVVLNNGDTIPSSVVIWAAGIKGNIPEGIEATIIARGNRIKTNRHCRVEGAVNIYAIGDLAQMETPLYPNGLPQVAPVAMQEADLLKDNLIMMANGITTGLKEFEYHDKGSMATIGRNLAVVDIPKPLLHFRGWFAWIIWMALHLMMILGVKNKFFVFFHWLYAYFTYDQNLRLILRGAEDQ